MGYKKKEVSQLNLTFESLCTNRFSSLTSWRREPSILGIIGNTRITALNKHDNYHHKSKKIEREGYVQT